MIRTAQTATVGFSLIVTTVPGLFYRVNGYANTGSTNFYIMLFDSTTVPANGTRPMKSWLAQGSFEFNEHVSDGLPCFAGITLAMSSTENTLTLATGGNTADIQCEYEEARTLAVFTGTSNVNTGGANFLTAWADAATPPKKLVHINWSCGEAGNCWLMGFANGTPPANGSVPVWQSPTTIAPFASADYYFGKQGRDFSQKDSSQVLHDGCILVVSSTANTLTIGVSGASTISADVYIPS